MYHRNDYEIDPNQELVSLGLSNFLGSAFSSYPITGSFTRSAVNNDTGAKTNLAGAITATVVLLTLLFLTSLFEYLPRNALAAIVINSVIGLVDIDEAKFLWKVNKRDFVMFLVAFLGTMFLGIEFGIAVAVGLSLIFVIYGTAVPHTAVLGQLPNTNIYRAIKQYPAAKTDEGIVVFRFDAPIYFANVSLIKEKLQKYVLYSNQTHKAGVDGGLVRFVVLEMGPVGTVDSTAIHAMKELLREYTAKSIQLCFANPNADVLEILERSGIVEAVGQEWLFVRVAEAVKYCREKLDDERVKLQMHDSVEEFAVDSDGKDMTDDDDVYLSDENKV